MAALGWLGMLGADGAVGAVGAGRLAAAMAT